MNAFAELVFDRPLDHAFSYSVPLELQPQVAVGKRVRCQFGRGEKASIGYVVAAHNTAPEREVKPIDAVLDDEALVDDQLLALTRWMADYYLCGWGQVLHAVVPAGVRGTAGTRNASFVQLLPREQQPTVLPGVTPRQKQLLDALKDRTEPVEMAVLAKEVGCTTAVINALVLKGLIGKFHDRIEKLPATLQAIEDAVEVPHLTEAIPMNADQQAAYAPIRAAIAEGGFRPFLLHGVTGSGKTEIYLQAIQEVIRRGREAIVLVPEISLTPQTIERFRGRCGRVAVLHSNLTEAERASYWRHAATGRVQVVVGARSAVFAPTRNLGLIVIDEEHETSFKQETTPRYHARDVALQRAKLAGVPIILGSATPGLESWHAAHTGASTLLQLPLRVAGRPMPAVQLIDMRHEPRSPGQPRAVGSTLERHMRSALAAKGQAILLLNRRGFSTHIHCPTCGYVSQCLHCDLSLTFHRDRAALVCHYCGWETLPLTQCPKCEGTAIRYQGLGTEKLQAELERLFPQYVVQRMDSDTMTKSGSHQRVLEAFRAGSIHILLGTQMIAKGLDFPNVTLVGVVNADVGLNLPDFRAAERTFQLLAQVAGRAGRGDKPGLVMVQTHTPDHPCIGFAAKHDYTAFADLELAFRREHQYPPYQKMARLIVRSEQQDAAYAFATQLAGSFKTATARSQLAVRVLGPAECPVFKLQDYYRFHFQLQAVESATLHRVLREVLSVSKPTSAVEYQVDVDPYSMM